MSRRAPLRAVSPAAKVATRRAARPRPALYRQSETTALPKPCGQDLLSAQEWADVAQALGMTARQLQITKLMFDDKTQRAIAATLGIVERTVREHLDRLYKKLNVHDRVGLVLRIVGLLMATLRKPLGERGPG